MTDRKARRGSSSEGTYKIPTKLRDDLIREVVLEIRFDSDELPEVVIGRLSDVDVWKKFKKNRLPVGDVPVPIRIADASLRFQPILELTDAEPPRRVRIGQNVLSYHLTAPYIGWSRFRRELEIATKVLFSSFNNLSVSRLGLRYINAVVPDRHFISGPHELAVDILVAGEKFEGEVNLNFVEKHSRSHDVMTRIASPHFVQGNVPTSTVLILDVDVSTPKDIRYNDLGSVLEWIEVAHGLEKVAFFKLLHVETVEKLREK